MISPWDVVASVLPVYLLIVAGVLLNLTPGPDVLYIMTRALKSGWRTGAVAALGITAGCFVHATAAALGVSAALGALGFTVPGLEQLIALSVALFGAMLVLSRQKTSTPAALGVVALAASFHGLAHGAEAPASAFVSYAAGFLLTTAALHFGGVLAGLAIRRHLASQQAWLVTGLGSLCGAAGLYLFSQV